MRNVLALGLNPSGKSRHTWLQIVVWLITVNTICISLFAWPAGQTTGQPITPLAFEVASIKPNRNGFIDLGNGQRVLSGRTHCHSTDTRPIPGDLIPLPGLGRCSVLNSTLTEIIDVAYGLRIGPIRTKLSQFIIGGPSWANTAAFDIEAKAEDSSKTTNEQLLAMLQTLLADRFKLKFHRETREVAGLALVLSKNGPKLKESSPDAPASFSMVPEVKGQNVSMETLANFLSLRTGSIVIDRTGLTGRYDVSLTWTPTESEFIATGIPARPASADQSGPSLITALQEQLGLRLEAEKVQREVIMIDAAEIPREN